MLLEVMEIVATAIVAMMITASAKMHWKSSDSDLDFHERLLLLSVDLASPAVYIEKTELYQARDLFGGSP